MHVMLAFALALAPVPACADAYPSQPVRLIVPYSPGSQVDVFARLVGERLAEALGQPVIIDNRLGASGNAASEIVARAAPDGHTLLVSGVVITLLPLTWGPRAVDPVAAFAPITRMAQSPLVIAANPSLGVDTLADLIALARRTPGKIAYATSGVGTPQHIAMTMLAQRSSVEFLHVPYANTGQMMGNVLSGEVPVVISFPATIDAHLKSGKMKALAVTSPARAAAWSDVPTVAESGFPGFDIAAWAGVLAPAGTSPEIVARINREILRILKLPGVREQFLAQGAEPVGNSPEAFAAEIRSSIARWAPVVKAAGIRVD